jgi:uncharacterized coiled-coil protein SlyX
MNNVQLYFAIGVPTFTVLVGIVIGIFQSNNALNQLNLRFTSLENRITSLESSVASRFSLIEAGMKTLVRASNDLDVRLARLEERLAR